MRPRRLVGNFAIAIIATLLIAFPVFAAAAVPTTIRLVNVNGVETFTTTGGALCPSGTSVNQFDKFGGGNVAGSFHGSKTLTCTDGTGTFRITYDAGAVFSGTQDQGGWHIIGGTGSYTTLKGGGNLVGTFTQTGIIDLYTGRVTL